MTSWSWRCSSAGRRERGSAQRVVAGQYLAFTAILAVSLAAAYGASFLPTHAIPYLGLIPITFGLSDAWKLWKNRQRGGDTEHTETAHGGGPTTLKVAATTFGSGGDNLSVYTGVRHRPRVARTRSVRTLVNGPGRG